MLIIEKLHEAARNYVRFLEQNRPHLAFQEIHLFILKDICDSYLESTKQSLWNSDYDRLEEITPILKYVVAISLQLMGTFMPFVCTYLLDRLHLRKSAEIKCSTILETERLKFRANNLQKI